jgi:hypothetical protein
MRSLLRHTSSQSAVITWLIAMALGLMPVPATSQSKVPLPDDIRGIPAEHHLPLTQHSAGMLALGDSSDSSATAG